MRVSMCAGASECMRETKRQRCVFHSSFRRRFEVLRGLRGAGGIIAPHLGPGLFCCLAESLACTRKDRGRGANPTTSLSAPAGLWETVPPLPPGMFFVVGRP